MSKILILTLVFPPDGVSTAQIMGDLASDLKIRGHSVQVLTTTPHYNRDADAEARQPLQPFWGSVLKKSEFRGIPVIHTIMPKKGTNVFLRLLAWTGFHVLGTAAGILLVSKPDVIIAPSPPLTTGLSAWVIGLFRRAPYVYNVQEIYPDIAIRLGALRNPRLIRFFFALERFVYRKAAKVTVIASRMRDRLLEKGVPRKKIEVIPNFVDIGDLSPLPKDNEFSRQHGVVEKFTVSYAGNMGVPQGLNTFIDAAHLLRKDTRIKFMMMGDGMQREALFRRVEALDLDNMLFLPHQPYSRVSQIYASSDVNLVPQAAETGFEAVPSKIYRIMACARPVIAVTDVNSDLARLVRESGCGLVVEPGSSEKLAAAVLNACENSSDWMKRGEAGLEHVRRYYAREIITGRYHDLVNEIVRC